MPEAWTSRGSRPLDERRAGYHPDGSHGTYATVRSLTKRNKKPRSCKESHDGATITQRCPPLASRQRSVIIDCIGVVVNTLCLKTIRKIIRISKNLRS